MQTSLSKSFGKILTAVLSLSVAILFVLSLVTAYFYFTVYDPVRFTDNVSSLIDTSYIADDASSKIETISNNYGFDAQAAKDVTADIDFKSLASEYFSDFYTAFISGNSEAPVIDFHSEKFLEVITANTATSLRPEMYEIEENRALLAEKYNQAVKYSVSSLSVDLVQSTLVKFSDKYVQITQIGKLFVPTVSAFTVCLIILLVLIIKDKKIKTAYSIFLALFTLSLIFTIPFSFLKAENLPARFNISFGGGYAYIKAVWDLLVGSAANIFTIVSTVLALVLLSVIIISVFKKKTCKNTSE